MIANDSYICAVMKGIIYGCAKVTNHCWTCAVVIDDILRSTKINIYNKSSII